MKNHLSKTLIFIVALASYACPAYSSSLIDSCAKAFGLFQRNKENPIMTLKESVPETLVKSTRIHVSEGRASPLEKFLQQSVQEMENTLGTFQRPKEITFVLDDPSVRGGSYLPDNQEILFSPRLAQDKSTEGIHAFKALAQHEYAHGVFYAQLGKYFPEWKIWFQSLEKRHLQLPSTAVQSQTIKRPEKLETLSRPYQELFSDLAVIVSQKDPDVISRSVKYLGANEKQSSARSFSGTVFNARWMEKEEHQALSPVRNFLWQQYFTQKKNIGKEAEIMDTVFSVIAEELLERNTNTSLHNIFPEEMNKRLLDKLYGALKEYE